MLSLSKHGMVSMTCVAKAKDYSIDLASVIKAGLRELAISGQEIKGNRILLKPNLVEPAEPESGQITTPKLIEAVARYCLE